MNDTHETTWIDPRAYIREQQTGMTSRQLLTLARREGWRRRKIYGRVFLSATDYYSWQAKREAAK